MLQYDAAEEDIEWLEELNRKVSSRVTQSLQQHQSPMVLCFQKHTMYCVSDQIGA